MLEGGSVHLWRQRLYQLGPHLSAFPLLPPFMLPQLVYIVIQNRVQDQSGEDMKRRLLTWLQEHSPPKQVNKHIYIYMHVYI